MNKTQKTPNNGFRIVWFMLLEATVSLIVISIAITTNTFIAILLLASLFAVSIKSLNTSATPDTIHNNYGHSFAPYYTIIDGWKSLFMPVYKLVISMVHTISHIHVPSHIQSVKRQESPVKTLVSV